LSEKFIKLLDSQRGLPTRMAKAIGKSSSFFSEIKRGKPVNADHLLAAGIVCGREKVIDLLSIDEIIKRDQIGDLQEDRKLPPGSTIYPRDTEGQRITVLREADPGRPSHSDVIGQFKNKGLARELNEMLLHIEAADPEMLRRDVRRFLQGIITAIESKKSGTDS
jgi:hypothetical protein